MFHPNVPNYLNFGGIGSVVGHEITHGFDDRGKQFDSSGVLRNWWKPETAKKYDKKAKCVIWLAGNYTVEQVNMTLDGVNTQGENIADFGGIKEARIAYGNCIIKEKLILPSTTFMNKNKTEYYSVQQCLEGTLKNP